MRKKGGLNEIPDDWQKNVHSGIVPDHKSHGYIAKEVKPSLAIINGCYKNYHRRKIQLKKLKLDTSQKNTPKE